MKIKHNKIIIKNNILYNKSFKTKTIVFDDLTNNEFYSSRIKPFEKINIIDYMKENKIKYLNVGYVDNNKNEFNFNILITFIIDSEEITKEETNLFTYNKNNYKPLFDK